MEKLTIYTYDPTGQRWQLKARNGKLKSNYNGFFDLTWDLDREFGFAYEDLGFGNKVVALSLRNDIAWQGRFEGIEPKLTGGVSNIGCTAVGGFTSLYDQPKLQGTIGASVAPETMIATVLASGYTPQILSSSLLATGHTTKSYQTGNQGTDHVAPGDAIKAICQSGTSTGLKVYPAVWENQQLITYSVATTPAADYIVRRANVGSISLRRALSTVYNEILCRYKTTAGDLGVVIISDAASIAALGITRTKVIDITGLQPTDAAGATAYANAELAQSKRVKNDSQAITLDAEYSIYSVATGQEVPKWSMLKACGDWIQVPDLFPRLIEGGTGNSNGDAAINTTFLISAIEYDNENGQLTITPENSAALIDLV